MKSGTLQWILSNLAVFLDTNCYSCEWIYSLEIDTFLKVRNDYIILKGCPSIALL